MVVALLAVAAPARAVDDQEEPPDKGPVVDCMDKATATLRPSASSVVPGTPVVLTWTTRATCNLKLTIQGPGFYGSPLADNGSRTVWPGTSASWILSLSSDASGTEVKATAAVRVELPPGSNTVSITRSDQNLLFVQMVQRPNMIVRVAGDVELDLTWWDSIPIAPGVQIIGDRSVHPRGPRLFITDDPRYLFIIGREAPESFSDNVRISGLRFDGGRKDPWANLGPDDVDAIAVFSSVNVEIDHNEFYGFKGTAVLVHDLANRLSLENADSVWIHDNWMHDNQHPTTDEYLPPFDDGHGGGYGVNSSEGAYALIERNVFDRNRHAIASDGKWGSGYLAYRNLSMGMGIDSRKFVIRYNHAFDVHARGNCGSYHYNCGPAGEYYQIGYNTFTDPESDDIRLRGTPRMGLDVQNNVYYKGPGAVVDNEGAITDRGGQVFGSRAFQDRSKLCDFDGDGGMDEFVATGTTWWFRSSRLGRYVYLYQSPKKTAEVQVGDVDGDGWCDVRDGPALKYLNQGYAAEYGLSLQNQVPEYGTTIGAQRQSDGKMLLVQANGSAIGTRVENQAGTPSWEGLTPFPGAAARMATARRQHDGRITVFAVTASDDIIINTQTAAGSSTWGGWVQLEGKARALAVALNYDNRLILFHVDAAGVLSQRKQHGVDSPWWDPPTVLDGSGTIRQIAADVNRDQVMELFALTSTGAVQHRVQGLLGAFNGWMPMDGKLSTLAMSHNADGRLEIFGTNTEGNLWHRWQNKPDTLTDWSNWSKQEGRFHHVTAESRSDGAIELFATDQSGQVFHRWQTLPGNWSGWVRLERSLRTDGRTPMPSVLGKTVAETNALLGPVGFTTDVVNYTDIYSCAEPGKVTAQYPAPGLPVLLAGAPPATHVAVRVINGTSFPCTNDPPPGTNGG